MDDLLVADNKSKGKDKKIEQSMPAKTKIESIDSYFSEPQSVSLGKTKQISPKSTNNANQFLRTSILKNEPIDEIIS
jgi:hypothetical protein